MKIYYYKSLWSFFAKRTEKVFLTSRESDRRSCPKKTAADRRLCVCSPDHHRRKRIDRCTAPTHKREEEKHENEIIEIKMVLNITHGATAHICTHDQKPHSHIEIYLFYWLLFFHFFSSTLNKEFSLALNVENKHFFSSLFELSHFIRVDKTIFYPCKMHSGKKFDCYRCPCTIERKKPITHLVYAGLSIFFSRFSVDNLILPVVRIISFLNGQCEKIRKGNKQMTTYFIDPTN